MKTDKTSNPIGSAAVIGVVGLWVAAAAHAQSIVWDQSPDTIGGELTSDNWGNNNVQNFADPVRFESAIRLTGIDIYMTTEAGRIGDQGLFTLREGAPDGELQPISAVVSVIDSQGGESLPTVHRLHADFIAPVTLKADTLYWVGIFGVSEIWSVAGVRGATGELLDDRAAAYGLAFEYQGDSETVGDTTFRLWGTGVGVGATVDGVDATVAFCANLTDPQRVVLTFPGPELNESWLCEDSGFTASPADVVRVFVGGRAASDAFRGRVDGLTGGRVFCRNLTQGVDVPAALSGTGDWDCQASGLPLTPGDVVQASITGSAE